MKCSEPEKSVLFLGKDSGFIIFGGPREETGRELIATADILVSKDQKVNRQICERA